jgi:hypothetical protein
VTTSVPTWCAYASLGGVYSLTFTASPSCNLPDDAVKRTYTATIAQTDAALTIVLSGARFGSLGQMTLNQFSGRVLGTAVSFAFYNGLYYGLYYGDGPVEQLADNRYLSFGGTAEATATDSGISAMFAGVVRVTSQVSGSLKPIAVCTASAIASSSLGRRPRRRAGDSDQRQENHEDAHANRPDSITEKAHGTRLQGGRT